MKLEEYCIKDHLQNTRIADLYYTFPDHYNNKQQTLEKIIKHYYDFLTTSNILTLEQQQDLNDIKNFYLNDYMIEQQLKQDYKECE